MHQFPHTDSKSYNVPIALKWQLQAPDPDTPVPTVGTNSKFLNASFMGGITKTNNLYMYKSYFKYI